MNKKAIVLHSGGMDSSVCLLMARDQGRDVISLGIDYKQRLRIELEYAKRICEKFEIPRRVISVEWDKPEREIPHDRSPNEMGKSISPAFLPGRNAVFLALGSAEAAGVGASEVWIGVNSIDYSGYPDCRKEFINAFETMINIAIPKGLKIVVPLINMSKPEIASKAKAYGLKEDDTWSCYTPVVSGSSITPCGRCDACVLHTLAWKNIDK
jgi:7-cyano-7-deazaguanine synthase